MLSNRVYTQIQGNNNTFKDLLRVGGAKNVNHDLISLELVAVKLLFADCEPHDQEQN